MYSIKNGEATPTKDIQKKNVLLPQLPPLDTRKSFLEKNINNESLVEVNTAITSQESYNYSSSKESTLKSVLLLSDSSPNSISKRRSYHSSNIQSPTVLSPRTSSHRTPSPIRTMNRRPPPPPSLNTSPQNKLRFQEKMDNTSSDDVEDATLLVSSQSFQDPSKLSDIFPRPPPVPTTMRNISGLSRMSESIESYYSDANYSFNNSSARHSSYNSLLGGKPLELAPSVIIPTQPFDISALTENKLYQCYSVYRLSDIYEWILKVYFEWFTEYIFGQFEFYQMIQRLLEFQIPNTFDQDIIDSNVDRIINSLLKQNAIRFEPNSAGDTDDHGVHQDEDISVVMPGLDIQGILTELLPCYSFDDTIQNDLHMKCYSTTCQTMSMTVSKRKDISFSNIIHKSIGVWADFWHLTSEDLDNINPRDVQKQSFIFDLIMLEERSLNMANAAVEIYGREFDLNLLPDEPEFAPLAFDVFKPLIELHTEFLLNPITWKIETKGKFITGIGKLYLKWCREAHDSYIIYAKAMATVHEILKYEKKRKSKFANWLTTIDNTPEITRSKMYHDVIFFGGFFKSLQNLPITLESILKNTDASDEDYEPLKLAIQEVKKLNSDVDKAHGEAIDHRNLIRFSKQLIFDTRKQENTTGYANLSTPSLNEERTVIGHTLIEDKLDLGLINNERKLIFAGPLLKKREVWLESLSVYVALLDNYMLITEITVKDKKKWYKLVERPIPIDYLSVETRRPLDETRNFGNDQSATSARPERLGQTPLTASRPNFLNSAVSKTLYNSETGNDSESGPAYKDNNDAFLTFKIRNTATNESFTFLASSTEDKEKWINSILGTVQKAKERIQTVFDFEILSTRFAYSEKDAPVSLPVAVEGSEMDIALKTYDTKRKEDIIFPLVSNVTTSTIFNYEGKRFLLVASNYGILARLEDGTDRPFQLVIQCKSVTMLETNDKLSLLFVLDNHNLLYFSLASILGAYYDKNKYLCDNSIIGIVIKDKVNCFKFAEDFGNSKHLLFERKGRVYVLTPEFDPITKRTKYFKEYKQYKLPSSLISIESLKVTRIIPFKKSFLVCTSKGFILFLDQFGDDGMNIPIMSEDGKLSEISSSSRQNKSGLQYNTSETDSTDTVKSQTVEHILKDVSNHRTIPLNCFQLNNNTSFILVYNKVLIKINCYGMLEDWRNDILTLDFNCTNAIIFETYLILISESLVHVYDINKATTLPLNKLIPSQIIKGKKIQLLNTAPDDPDVILNLSHPNIPNRQLLLKCNTTRT